MRFCTFHNDILLKAKLSKGVKIYAFVNVYYHENILNEEELKKIGECIHLSLIKHFNIPENDF